jgi:hypothetical protein
MKPSGVPVEGKKEKRKEEKRTEYKEEAATNV